MRTIQEIKTNKEALEKFLQQTICQFEDANGILISELNWYEHGEYNDVRQLGMKPERNAIEIKIEI